jgi:hypothetical protein
MRGTPRQGRGKAWRTLAAAALTLAAALSWTAVAHASAFGDTFNDYRAHGKVNPCKFSAHELKQAKKQVPPDIDQYAPDFPAALDAALQAQARGACGGGGSNGKGGTSNASSGVAGAAGTSGGASPPAAGGSATSSPGSTPAPHQGSSSPLDVSVRNTSRLTHGSSDPPAPVIVIALIAAALVIPALVWSLVRWAGWQPGWVPGARHTLAEASWRTGNGWAEFADWMRFGH